MSWYSQMSALRPQAWVNTTGLPIPQSTWNRLAPSAASTKEDRAAPGLLAAAGRPPVATKPATAAAANVVVALLLSIATSPQPRAGAASTKPTTDLIRPSPATTRKSVPLI